MARAEMTALRVELQRTTRGTRGSTLAHRELPHKHGIGAPWRSRVVQSTEARGVRSAAALPDGQFDSTRWVSVHDVVRPSATRPRRSSAAEPTVPLRPVSGKTSRSGRLRDGGRRGGSRRVRLGDGLVAGRRLAPVRRECDGLRPPRRPRRAGHRRGRAGCAVRRAIQSTGAADRRSERCDPERPGRSSAK